MQYKDFLNRLIIVLIILLSIFSHDIMGWGKVHKRKKSASNEVVVQAVNQHPDNTHNTFSAVQENDEVLLEEIEHLVASKPTKHRVEATTYKEDLIRPETATDDQEEMIEVNFENTDLQNILDWISKMFNVHFLIADDIDPVPAGMKKVADNKITFKTHVPLTKKKLWDLFVVFIDLWGLALSPSAVDDSLYQVVNVEEKSPNAITRNPIPAFINIDWQTLPNNDMYIRYVYFVKNSDLTNIVAFIKDIKGQFAKINTFPDLDALILSDKASNIRGIMQIIVELDKNTSPEAMSVLKLQRVDAEDVAKLYTALTQKEDPRGIARLLGAKKVPTKMYFPEDTKVIPEKRTNSLILLGNAESIKKIEDFIITYIDTELKIPLSPLFVYELQYASAEDAAKILTQVVKFGENAPASEFGGVRAGDQYFRPMTIVAEKEGNKLLIRAEKEDYIKVKEIIEQLDVKQPQVAIELLVVEVIDNDNRELGVQMRNKRPDNLANNVDFQNSGLPRGAAKSPIQVNPDTGSLVANLVNLAQGQSPGSTILTIGDISTQGVWAILQVLQTRVHTNILSNPFVVTTNKYPAQIALGETRRLAASQIFAGEVTAASFTDVDANIQVRITPQINSDGIINLDILFELTIFTVPFNAMDPFEGGTRATHVITTNANVANGEVLAFGGLLRNQIDDLICKVPALADIPLLGWFFKNKIKNKTRDNILVFISPHIIEPELSGGVGPFSLKKAEGVKGYLFDLKKPAEFRDPIHRWFFKDHHYDNVQQVDDFLVQKYQARRQDIPITGIDTEYESEESEPLVNVHVSTNKRRHNKRSLLNMMSENEDKELT